MWKNVYAIYACKIHTKTSQRADIKVITLNDMFFPGCNTCQKVRCQLSETYFYHSHNARASSGDFPSEYFNTFLKDQIDYAFVSIWYMFRYMLVWVGSVGGHMVYAQ